MALKISRYVPATRWLATYSRAELSSDLLAAVIVTIMLIPQSLAYALLAGLPPEAGLYASIVPILLYSALGTSRALAVGPVAVVSLMTASAIGQVAESGSAGYATASLTLAFLSGAMLMLMGFLRLGMVANFLSNPVIAGFITASGLLIAVGQLGPIFGIASGGDTLPNLIPKLLGSLSDINLPTMMIGISATAFLFWIRKGLKPFLIARGVGIRIADLATKIGPVMAIVATTFAAWALGLADRGVAIVGEVPQGLPPFTLPGFAPDLVKQLFMPAALISIIGFVESISVAKTLAAKKAERIDADQELIALGAANLGAAFSGGYPVTGGFARSAVNNDAGAATPAAGAFTAIGLMLASLLLTPLIHDLPKATLAATIIVAVLGLVDMSILKKTWKYSRADFIAVAATIALTLLLGVEVGVATGVFLSVGLHLYKTSRPHVAEVGRVPGTEHFRNINRHQVETDPAILNLRVDESLYFVNASFLEDMLAEAITRDVPPKHVVLMCSAINSIDFSALETLKTINSRLGNSGITLHLSEVKGPVMDRLCKTRFLQELSGKTFLSQFEAWQYLHSESADS